MSELRIVPNTDLNIVFNEKIEDNAIIENIATDEFKTPIRNSIFKNPILSKILESIEPIDFDILLTNENAERNGKESKNTLDDEEKIVIILENLLQKIDYLNSGMIIDNHLIYVFNGGYWETINLKVFKAFLSEVAMKSGLPKLKARKRRTNEALYNQFELTASSFIEKNKKDGIKINLLNGTFHVRNGEGSEVNELKMAQKEDYFKYQLSFAYDSQAKAPLFQKFLDEVLPDKDSQKVLLEYIGYTLTKGMKLERLLILHGTGLNGKSVFFEIITALLGEANVSTTDMRKLCDENGYYRADLASKLVNYASEFGGKVDIQMFKKLVSGEPVDARLPHKEPIVVSDYCKFIFNTNRLPEVEHTEAFFRRPIILGFYKKIQKSDIDIHLAKKIIDAELSGIFNLVLEGLDRLLKQDGFSESTLVDDELKKYKKDSNSVSMFLEEENWESSLTEKFRFNDLYQQYKQYCIESNQRSFTRPNFGKRLRELNFIVEPGTNNYTVVLIVKKNNDSCITIDPFSVFTDKLKIN